MPYRVRKSGNGYVVQVQKGGKWRVKKRYSSKAAAERYKRALYANVPHAKRRK
jgi:hypothetical protein